MDERIDPKFGAFCLACIGLNAAYFLNLIHKQKKTIDDLITDGRELIRVAEHGNFIINTILEDVELTSETAQKIDEKITLHRLDVDMMSVPGIAEKTSLLMRSYPSTQGDTMTDQPTPTPEVVAPTPVEKPSRLRTLTANHPKITRAVKLTAAGLGIAVVVRAATNAQHNKEKLAEAKDHALEAGDALSDSVTLNDES